MSLVLAQNSIKVYLFIVGCGQRQLPCDHGQCTLYTISKYVPFRGKGRLLSWHGLSKYVPFLGCAWNKLRKSTFSRRFADSGSYPVVRAVYLTPRTKVKVYLFDEITDSGSCLVIYGQCTLHLWCKLNEGVLLKIRLPTAVAAL